MKVPLRWLLSYAATELPAREIAHRLTMSGTEVGGLHAVGDSWEGVVVGEIAAVDPHPNADRLRLATVDLGGGERHTVVCGAPNLVLGERVAFARNGATLRDSHSGTMMTLKPARIRGVESAGMVCSERELGLSDEHEGILVLPAEAPLGRPLVEFLGDLVLDLELTRNRADCFGILGVAREVAVLTGSPLQEPPLVHPDGALSVADLARVTIEDPDLCPRYTAAVVQGIRLGPSPEWMQQRLGAAGMRPINNVVDVTNYVMLEYGQPLHAFDYDRVAEHHIVVRRAGGDRRLVTLDGVERSLEPDMLLICDASGPIGLAGVMGGGNSEVSASTTAVLLESASFDNLSIRATQRRLGLRTEASHRFEKLVSRELPPIALQRAVALLVDLCGGTAAAGMIDLHPRPWSPPVIRFGTRQVARKLGASFDAATIQSTLEALGCEVRATGLSGEEFDVVPPHWRTDLLVYDDLVEEVARIVGYDAIPTRPLAGPLPNAMPARELQVRERVRDLVVGQGCQETISYSLLGKDVIERAQSEHPGHRISSPIRLFNAMSEDQAWLRTTLRPSLLLTLATNQRFATEQPLRLFEIGRVFLAEENDLPEQKYILGIILAGPRQPPSWHGAAEPTDYSDARGLVDGVLAGLGLEASYEATADEGFYAAGQAARVSVGSSAIGSIGRVAPAILEAFDIALRDVYYVGLSMPLLTAAVPERAAYRPLPRVPELLRDLAVVVDDAVPAVRIEAMLRQGKLVRRVRLFDVYRGEQIPAGKKSLAFSLHFQADDRTLAEAEVEKIQQGLVARLERELGATLR